MNPTELATRDIAREIREEITRYGGSNPHGQPAWRVVWAQNVLEQSFGTISNMPRVGADIDVSEVSSLEPQSFESGEFWLPRYMNKGAILERWFPATTWGTRGDWESEMAEDGITRLKGEYPRHGDYYMVSDQFYPEMPTIGFWKNEIQREIRRQANTPKDPAAYLSTILFVQRKTEEARRQAFLEEVNNIHRGQVEPLLATVGRTAQLVREGLLVEAGLEGHLSAG